MSTAVATTVAPKQNGIIRGLDYLRRCWIEFMYGEIYYARVMHEVGLEKINTLALRIARAREKGVRLCNSRVVIQGLSKELSLPKRFITMLWASMIGPEEHYYL